MISPPDWATAPRLSLPPNAPTAAFICGGGGIGTVGFEMAGFRSLWNIDYDPKNPKLSNAITAIYEQNFGYEGHSTIQQTIQEVAQSRFRGLETPDIIVLTQPCCEFSRANPKGKETTVETSIAYAAAQAIVHFNPKAVAIENVPEYERSSSWATVKIALQASGYHISSGVRSSSRFGVPQERKRFLAIATRDSEAPAIPIGGAKPIGWYEAICDRLHLLEDAQPTAKQQTIASELSHELLSQILLFDRVGIWGAAQRIRTASQPTYTIRKSIFLDGENNSRSHVMSVRFPDGTWRKIGLREIARFFSLPDWYSFPNKAWSAGSAMGNGIPSLMAAAIGQTIKLLLETKENNAMLLTDFKGNKKRLETLRDREKLSLNNSY